VLKVGSYTPRQTVSFGSRPFSTGVRWVAVTDSSVNIDYKQMGVGGDDSWGARTHEQYRLTGKEYKYAFRIKALGSGDNPLELAKQKL
jgi:hypothetical protein